MPSSLSYPGNNGQALMLLPLHKIAAVVVCIFVVTSLISFEILSRTTQEDQDEAFLPGGMRDPVFAAGGIQRTFDDAWGKSREAMKEAMGARHNNHNRRRVKEEKEEDDDSHMDRYEKLRADYEELYPPDDEERIRARVQELRGPHTYESFDNPMGYDIHNCPARPPEGYPYQWNVMDVINNWNPNDTNPPKKIHQGLCIFDYNKDLGKADLYRKAEVPFIIMNDIELDRTVERWNHGLDDFVGKDLLGPEDGNSGDSEVEPAPYSYLEQMLGQEDLHTVEFSKTNFFQFYRIRGRKTKIPKGWEKPTSEVKMRFQDWFEKAKEKDMQISNHPEDPHWYFRVNGGYPEGHKPDMHGYLLKEMPMFDPEKGRNFYLVQPSGFRGINCRFGMRGVTAANHYDGNRNFVFLFGGERRYFLSHPNQCEKLTLYPLGHPSGRHSAIDWANPNLKAFPQFKDARVNEVVLQAGHALYLPTYWFHFIISQNTNFQCNGRSGVSHENDRVLDKCGFGHGTMREK